MLPDGASYPRVAPSEDPIIHLPFDGSAELAELAASYRERVLTNSIIRDIIGMTEFFGHAFF